MEEAVQYAISWGTELSRQRAYKDGAKDVEIVVDREDDVFSLTDSKKGGLLIDARVTITAIGKPQLFFEDNR